VGGSWAIFWKGRHEKLGRGEEDGRDETRRDEKIWAARRRWGRGRAARGVITALPSGVEGYLRGEPGGLWRGGGLVDKREEGCCVISGSARNGVGLPRCR